MLHLGFAGLDSVEAASIAFTDNAASLAVSRKLGYRPDGIARRAVRGRLAIDQRLRLTRAAWEGHRSVPVTIEGLAPCLSLFGASR
ncbi:GNAT family N-acetyltransferase [Saccharothrix sp. ALI-22-I]|uniref:GNAT family N-acetyltransferase n=1 Tax=Saccharothrix sp. ALI-22-I TaxID=1933778 RepID=UPI001EE6B551|nr:GNAT family protein [Saccharothrix sp. ALI-22-I]